MSSTILPAGLIVPAEPASPQAGEAESCGAQGPVPDRARRAGAGAAGAPRHDAQGAGAGDRRLGAASRQSRIRRRQRLDPRPVAGHPRAPVLLRRASGRRDHPVARVAPAARNAGEPRRSDAAARAGRRRRPARNGRWARRRARPLVAHRPHRAARGGEVDARPHAGRGPGLSLRRTDPRDRKDGGLQRQRKSSASTARTPIVATSAARSRRRFRSTPRR